MTIHSHHLHILGSLKVNIMPYCGNKPPILKNNYCEVQILFLQSARIQGGCPEWFTKLVSISNILPIYFAQVGNNSGSVNFYAMLLDLVIAHF